MIRPLTAEDIERIHQASLDVLARTGIWFRDCPEAVAILQQHGCTVEGTRVRFPRDVVQECLTLLPPRDRLGLCVLEFSHADELDLSPGASHVGLIGNAYYIYDYETRRHRDCVETDVDDKALIMDSLRNLDGDYCNLVLSSERLGRAVTTAYDTVEACMAYIRRRVTDRLHARDQALRRGGRLPVRWLQRSPQERRLEVLALMALQGAGSAEDLLLKGDTGFVWCNPISPLQYHPHEALAIVRVARGGARSRWVMISPEVMMGATGPITLAGTLVQQNAEVLAGTVLAQLARPGTPVIYGCVSAVMDMRTAQISQGNLETFALNAAAVQLADHYGMPSRIAPGNTSAREPGARAAAEALLGLYVGLASGANLITTALLDSTLMISYAHLVLIDEMIDSLRKVVGGISTDSLGLDLAEIEEQGHPSPGFMSSDYTVERMKRDIHYSDYVGRTGRSYEDWYEQAHRRVVEILAARSAPAELDAPTQERLSALESHLRADQRTWRRDDPGWWQGYARALS